MTLSGLEVQSILLRIAPTNQQFLQNATIADSREKLPAYPGVRIMPPEHRPRFAGQSFNSAV